MAYDLMHDIRFWRVERCGVMPNVLGTKKCSGGERLKKHARLNQTGDGLKLEAADCSNLLVYLAQLWNAIRRKRQALHTLQIFCASMRPMCGPKRLPNSSPNLMLLVCVRRVVNFLPGTIAEGKLRDAVAARAIFEVAKAWMIRSELNNSISIGRRLVCVQWNHAHVRMVS